MPSVFALLILSFIGTLGARQPDIDINRIKVLPKDFRFHTPTYHRRRSIVTDQYNRGNDYDHHSGRVTKLRAPVQLLHDTPSTTEAQGTIYQPRQDPRAFYQSDAYVKEINRKNINNEVSSVYVERGEVQANEHNFIPVPIRFTDNELNSIGEEVCIRCPYDRMLVAKRGLDRALLQQLQLKTCSGQKAPRDTHFIHMYGPNFGSLVKAGSHIVVGRITRKGGILQTCKMQIHVLIQTCSVPKYLVPHCRDQNKTCIFTCRNPRNEIVGPEILTCGEDMKWSEKLPACRVRRWCEPPPPPEHGTLACHGDPIADPSGSRLAEGTRCSVKCDRGWYSLRAHAYTKCRRGLWTHKLKCQPNPVNKKS